MFIIFLVIGLIESGVFLFLMYRTVAARQKLIRDSLRSYELEVASKKEFIEKVRGLLAQMQPFNELHRKVIEVKALGENLRTERGRITITLAELETVESRLRELEEIERELEASNSETEKELSILRKKDEELKKKNEELKLQLAEKAAELEKFMTELQVSAEVAEQLNAIKTQIASCEQQIDALLLQVQQCDEQYISLKMKYDALDIEYAQLYEKFAESGDAPKSD